MALPGGARILLLDESYNASGASMRAALAVLALQPGRHVAVLGDMLELGDAAPAGMRGCGRTFWPARTWFLPAER